MKCPVCHKIRNDKKARLAAKKLAATYGLISEMCNPGGRELRFEFGSIQLSDMCDNCDLRTLRRHIKKGRGAKYD